LCVQLINVGEEVLLFYNDRNSFQTLLELMRSERDRLDAASPLMYHISLVQLLALCTEGKNVYTEIKCHSLLPLDDIVRVVTHSDCVPEVILPIHTNVMVLVLSESSTVFDTNISAFFCRCRAVPTREFMIQVFTKYINIYRKGIRPVKN